MNADEQGYNGWKNYETWLVNLHLGNDLGLHDAVLEVTREALEKGHETWRVADAIKSYVEDDMIEPFFDTTRRSTLEELLIRDLVGGALSAVDWMELLRIGS